MKLSTPEKFILDLLGHRGTLRLLRIGFMVAALAVFSAAVAPESQLHGVDFIPWDKAAHFIAFFTLTLLAAMQSIPGSLYEAARVDGATRWQQFRAITLPSLRPALVPAVVLSVVWTFNMFNIIFLVSGGEPGGANEILITKAYKIAFEQYQYAYAAAYSTVIFIILLVYGYFQTRMTRATESY